MKHKKKTFRSLTDAIMLLTLLSIPAVMVIPRRVGALFPPQRSDETSNVRPDCAPSGPREVPDGKVNESDAQGPYMQQFPANPFIDKEHRGEAGGRGKGRSYKHSAGHESL